MPPRLVPSLSRSAGRALREADERWTAAWLAAIEPTPAETVASASKNLRKLHGWPVPGDRMLRAIAQLAIARVHLARAEAELHDPKRARQSWLCADVRRAQQMVAQLSKRAAKGDR